MHSFGDLKRVVAATASVAFGTLALAGEMAIGDFTGNRVVRVDDQSGAFRGVLAQGGGLDRPLGFAYGPDNLLYVSSYGTGEIKRYNERGEFVSNFGTTPRPHGLAFFGGDVIVSNHNFNTVSRLGSLSWTSVQRAGRLYHSVVVRNNRIFVSFSTAQGGGIEEFHPFSGSSLGDFVPITRGLVDVQGFAWGPDNRLYATSSNSRRVFRFHGDTGAPDGFLTVTGGDPLGIRFSSSGDLVNTSWGGTQAIVHSPSTGRFVRNLLPAALQLVQPWYMERIAPTIEGRATFVGWTRTALPTTQVTVEFLIPGTNRLVTTRSVALASTGRFLAPSPHHLSEYDMRVRVPRYLPQTRRIDTRDTSRSFPTFSFVTGDIDGNNAIDARDYAALVALFGLTSNSPGWNSIADLNGDGTINTLDLTVFAQNFGQGGS